MVLLALEDQPGISLEEDDLCGDVTLLDERISWRIRGGYSGGDYREGDTSTRDQWRVLLEKNGTQGTKGSPVP